MRFSADIMDWFNFDWYICIHRKKGAMRRLISMSLLFLLPSIVSSIECSDISMRRKCHCFVRSVTPWQLNAHWNYSANKASQNEILLHIHRTRLSTRQRTWMKLPEISIACHSVTAYEMRVWLLSLNLHNLLAFILVLRCLLYYLRQIIFHEC